MNMRSIYANPYKYACKCDIPIELAKIACLKQRHFIKEQQKHPMYCPICKSKNMNFESGSYEEGYGERKKNFICSMVTIRSNGSTQMLD